MCVCVCVCVRVCVRVYVYYQDLASNKLKQKQPIIEKWLNNCWMVSI